MVYVSKETEYLVMGLQNKATSAKRQEYICKQQISITNKNTQQKHTHTHTHARTHAHTHTPTHTKYTHFPYVTRCHYFQFRVRYTLFNWLQ